MASPSSSIFQPVQYLKGIGPRKAAALEEIGIRTILDLLYYLPRRYLDRSAVVSIAALREVARSGRGVPIPFEGEADQTAIRREATVIGEVRSFRVFGAGRKARFVLVLADTSGSMQCVWFGGVQYWRHAFQIGEQLAVSGEPTLYGNVLQIVHPDIDRIAERDGMGEKPPEALRGGLLPLYSTTQALSRTGLESSGFRRLLGSLLQTHAERLQEYLPPALVQERDFPSFGEALRSVHFPANAQDLERSRRRIKYDELFLFQLKLALKRRVLKTTVPGIAFDVRSSLARRMLDALPFPLTGAQVRVLKEIAADLGVSRPMNRLLQGDVGSGKTVVALTAMLVVIDNGYQAIFMAPTEILAEQHFATIRQFLGTLPVTARLLVGAQRSRLRQDILDDIRSGRAQLVVGTHALLEKEVEFAKLGLVVIDEQHRFGVMQRAEVRRKGENPDVLVMTATPIPRTLSLTLYGDLDVSVLDELPRGRRPVTTVLKHDDEKESVFRFVREQLAAGRQAYFVYPLIEESETLDLKAATSHYEYLRQEVFPGLRLGLLHGRLRGEEKELIMQRFKNREIDLLVATTVIEVGIDVPNATVMVIENAERFGLAQLHQLRGRVGRGSEQSYCILIARQWVTSSARRAGEESGEDVQLAARRLATMVKTNDGFAIAEMDLQLRGPGDFFGTRQSGMPQFRAANLLTDTSILNEARTDAFALVDRDPHLRLAEHRALAAHLRATFLDDLSMIQAG